MSIVDALRAKADKAAKALQNAQAAAEKAGLERHERNMERRTVFWSDAGDRCTAALRAAADARTAVVDLVAAGDVAGALEAYAVYVRAVGASQVLVSGAQNATATYVYPVRRVVDGQYAASEECRTMVSEWTELVPPGQYTIEYGAGVPHGTIPDPVPFVALLESGTAALLAAHTAAFRTDLMAPLNAELEPED